MENIGEIERVKQCITDGEACENCDYNMLADCRKKLLGDILKIIPPQFYFGDLTDALSVCLDNTKGCGECRLDEKDCGEILINDLTELECVLVCISKGEADEDLSDVR